MTRVNDCDRRVPNCVSERILGSGDCVDRVLMEADEKTTGASTIRERKKRVEQLIVGMCKKGNVSLSQLKGGSRRRTIPRVRAEIATSLGHHYG